MPEGNPDIRRFVDELTKIEFEHVEDVRRYAYKLRDLQRAVAIEAELSADELQGLLQMTPVSSTESGGTTRKRAKMVATHLRRTGEYARSGAISSVKLWSSMKRHYGQLMTPDDKKKKKLDFN